MGTPEDVFGLLTEEYAVAANGPQLLAQATELS